MDINILLALQEFRNGVGSLLSDFALKMTFFGELNTVLVLMAVVYWSVSKELGTYLLMGWSGNRLVNGMLKVTVCAYRPWIRDARIIPYGNSMETATGYSFPSGHTMNAATVFGGEAVRSDMPKSLRIAAGIMVALVAFSRIFLGVHTPQDVLAGTAAGLLGMWLTFKMMRLLEIQPEKDGIVVTAGVLLAAAIALYAAYKPYPADYDAAGKPVQMPDGYAARAYEYDERGNTTKVTYLDAEGEPVNGRDGYAVTEREYSTDNRMTREIYLDKNGGKTDGRRGYAEVLYSYNEDGRLTDRQYLNAAGETVE